jgi:hypothetical protein
VALRDEGTLCPDCGLQRTFAIWEPGDERYLFVGMLCRNCNVLTNPCDLLDDPERFAEQVVLL